MKYLHELKQQEIEKPLHKAKIIQSKNLIDNYREAEHYHWTIQLFDKGKAKYLEQRS